MVIQTWTTYTLRSSLSMNVGPSLRQQLDYGCVSSHDCIIQWCVTDPIRRMNGGSELHQQFRCFRMAIPCCIVQQSVAPNNSVDVKSGIQQRLHRSCITIASSDMQMEGCSRRKQ
mmetsp:Transcript_38476/g.89998  ORF Transcript_38476/g.89998 Transcript_38476/m.89998 type:complete len:115 (-) Transcript_38476:504-848(-)